jgi:2,4-dienoyl-CoA reductase-like NADH-dependent reductase (Old Yellow Enzyme family)/thioredoxin reductase
VQTTSVDHPRGNATHRQLGIDDDRYLKGLSELAQTIKGAGTKVAIQLEHGGRYAHSAITGQQPVGPSAADSVLGQPVRELTVTEIAELQERYVKAVVRAQKAGFEGVEIHGAHGHLLAQFLSPTTNQRKDRYGGSLENRARFLLEVIRACRTEAGPDYPIWCRIDGAEYGIGASIDCAQATQTAHMAEEAGVDAIHVSVWAYGPHFVAFCPGVPGFHLLTTSVIKNNVRIPVIAVGRITPELGEWALREGVADIVAMGRALIADPYLPKKAAEGKLEDIVPCIGCWGCIEASIQAIAQAIVAPGGPIQGDLKCSVNPAVGRERELPLTRAPVPKRIVVVGGGPGGMEAARVARLRGHDVTLLERDTELGGQLAAAAMPPHKEAISLLSDYFTTQLNNLGVRCETGKEATLESVAAATSDDVIWAAGVIPVKPDIPGIDEANVVFASDVLTGRAIVGDTVVIIGAETVGCETANFLSDMGKKVTVVRRGPQVLTKMGPIVQMQLLDDLARKEVTLLTGVTYEGFDGTGLKIRTGDGEEQILSADTYVLATGGLPNSGPVHALKENFKNVYVIGDSLEPRSIRDAITGGFEVGLRI